MHYNENSNRMQAVSKSGRSVYSYSFPRGRGGEAIIRQKKTELTFGELVLVYYSSNVMPSFHNNSIGTFVHITTVSKWIIISQNNLSFMAFSFKGYASKIIWRCFKMRKEQPRTLREEQERMRSIAPQHLSAGYDIPDKEQMIKDLKTRFTKNTLIYWITANVSAQIQC